MADPAVTRPTLVPTAHRGNGVVRRTARRAAGARVRHVLFGIAPSRPAEVRPHYGGVIVAAESDGEYDKTGRPAPPDQRLLEEPCPPPTS